MPGLRLRREPGDRQAQHWSEDSPTARVPELRWEVHDVRGARSTPRGGVLLVRAVNSVDGRRADGLGEDSEEMSAGAGKSKALGSWRAHDANARCPACGGLLKGAGPLVCDQCGADRCARCVTVARVGRYYCLGECTDAAEVKRAMTATKITFMCEVCGQLKRHPRCSHFPNGPEYGL